MCEKLRSLGQVESFADIGCCDGFVTAQLAGALQCKEVAGFDFNHELIEQARASFSGIDFQQWDICSAPLPRQYSVVTCLEVLEHVRNLETALRNLLAITRDVLLITVPIEVGAIGFAKTLAKLLTGRKILTDEHHGMTLREYFASLLLDYPTIHFRNNLVSREWSSHTGFDHRYLGRLLLETACAVESEHCGWNMLFTVRKLTTTAASGKTE